MTHNFHHSILRAYDIRGLYNKTLFDKDAFFVGKAFASFLHRNKKKKIAVACDGRTSSPALKAQLLQALSESGLEIFDIGLGPTPMLYFAVYHLDCDAGIMVTGSHNPKDHNGFKITLRDRPFYGDDILALDQIARRGDFVEVQLAQGPKNIKERDIKDDYIEKILSDCLIAKSKSNLLDEIDEFRLEKKLKIAWDAGNGAAGEIITKLTKRIAASHILLFDNIDGTFPNHHPDPTVLENLQDLIKTVRDQNCDLGIAFDGDGDRIGIVDNEGEVIWGDQLMIFYAREILQYHPGATIIADVKASNTLFGEIKKAGGNPLMWKTGHSLIKAKMKETKAVLAGEMSGHIFFADKYFGFDDALYAAIRIINIIYKSAFSLSHLRKLLPRTFSTAEIRIACSESSKFQIVEDLKVNLRKSGLNFDDIDGIRVTSEIGWWLIRASNTQSVLVARCEATSQENLKQLKENLRKNLEFCQVKIPQELFSF
jgi:phosphomannomutase